MKSTAFLFSAVAGLSLQASSSPTLSDGISLVNGGDSPDVAISSRAFFATWANTYYDAEGFSFDAMGARLDRSGALRDEPTLVQPTTGWYNGNTVLKVASDGRNFVIVQLRGEAKSWFVDAESGTVAAPALLPLPPRTSTGSTIAIAGGRSGYAAAWTVYQPKVPYTGPGDFLIAVMRMDAFGRAMWTNAVIINPDAHYTQRAQIALRRDRIFVLWHDLGFTEAAILDANGQTLSSTRFYGRRNLAAQASIVVSRGTFVAAWNGPSGLALAAFNIQGQLLRTNSIALPQDVEPTLVSTVEGFLAITTEHLSTNSAVRAYRLGHDLRLIDEPILIDGPDGALRTSAAAAISKRNVLVLIGRKNNTFNQARIVSRRLTFSRKAAAGRGHGG
jgi:hypothetical protein